MRRPRREGLRPLASLAVAMLAGCATVLGIDSDRHLSEAVTEAGPVEASTPLDPWKCLNDPDQMVEPTAKVHVHLVVMDAVQPSTAAGAVDGGSDLDTVSGSPLAGVTVRPCVLRDPACAIPVDVPAVTDDGGMATFALGGDFVGFFDMRRDDLLPATLYPGNLRAGDLNVSFPAFDISVAGLEDLASVVANAQPVVDPDAGLGHMLVTVYDCNDHQAPGVSLAYSVALGAPSVPFYFKHGIPNTMATQTDSFGLAGAINVPAGQMTATATLVKGSPSVDAGASVGTATFQVQPGAITFAWIRVRSH